MPPKQSDPKTIFSFITGDFRCAWDALAREPDASNRGNFLFALQVMIALEWVMRFCSQDDSLQKRFLDELENIDSRYFTKLPGGPSKPPFPRLGDESKTHLIWVIFDILRNGQAHQYEQVIVRLPGSESFTVAIAGGANPGLDLASVPKRISRKKYLGFREESGHGWIYLHVGLLFLDIEKAVTKSGILESVDTFPFLKRPEGRGKRDTYKVSLSQLASTLDSGKHVNFIEQKVSHPRRAGDIATSTGYSHLE